MPTANSKPHDPRLGLQFLLVLDGIIRCFIWWSSIAFTAVIYFAIATMPDFSQFGADLRSTWSICASFGELVILYNLVYVAELIILRLVVPTPKEGTYEIGPGKKLDRQLLLSAAVATLVKARYHPPFPGFLVFHISNLPPLKWLMGPIFGPKSRSCYFADPCILDPHFVEIGKNVTIGFGTTIAGHVQERDSVSIRRTIIEDDVLIGGYSVVSGAHLKKGAIIGISSVVLPGSVVGPNEYWSGNPARRRRTLSPTEEQKPESQDLESPTETA